MAQCRQCSFGEVYMCVGVCGCVWVCGCVGVGVHACVCVHVLCVVCVHVYRKTEKFQNQTGAR